MTLHIIFCLIRFDPSFRLDLHDAKLDFTSVNKNGLDCSEPEVVMLLEPQLFVDKPERAGDLESEVTGGMESYTVEKDLGDKERIGYHHSDLSE